MTNQEMLPGMENTLPLFSGTPQRVTHKARKPAANVPQRGQQSFASCRLCRDTGRLNSGDQLHYCWCSAGTTAREEDRARRGAK